ncbi:hypothetical protein GCM10028856_19840 [Halopiger thermotolerans]
MHAVSFSFDPADSADMAFEPPVECPICTETLELDRTLEDHLVEKHTHREVASYLVDTAKRVEVSPPSD